MAFIHFENIVKNFEGDTHALRGISLDIEKGELVTLLGPSGCGKSTLLRCLAGLESVTSGKIFLDNNDITGLSSKERQIGMVFQQYSLFPNLTVEQNIGFGLQIKKMKKEVIREKVESMLQTVGLSEKIDQYPHQLSGGQQQRVALARALVMEPKVLLLDEPMSAIDALLRRNLQIEIRRIQQQFKITTVFVTHDQDEAMVMSDRIHLLNTGILEQSGTPLELYTSPRTKFAASFIGHYNIINSADFKKVTGIEFASSDIAIRPEVVSISLEKPQGDGLCIKGIVAGSVSHGNVLRYSINAGPVILMSDVLFDTAKIFNEQQEVYLSFGRDDLLPVD